MTENPNDILLTEDGHPIGEVVLADNSSLPQFPTQRAIEEENKEELLRAEAQELTGSPDADAAIAELYPKFGDVDLRKRAMNLFIVEQKDYREVAKSVDVPERTVSMWIYTFRWDSLARKELAVQRAQSMLDLERIRTQKRTEIAKKQLEQAERIRDRAARAIADGDVSLKSGTEAWAAAARIEHTITGVSESGAVVDADGHDPKDRKGASDGKTPLVVVFQGGGLPPTRKA